MIFFPSLFPDELLYSAFARYHRDSGNENHKMTMVDLFGDPNVCATYLFPTHLKSLCTRMPVGCVHVPEKLVADHTFQPYYSLFIPENRNLEMKNQMVTGKGTSLHMQLGIPASTIKLQIGLRYCPTCIIDDQSKFGEAYWHRSHQAEGVFVCHIHSIMLFISKATYIDHRNKHQFVSLEQAYTYDSDQDKLIENIYDNNLLFIANQSHILINTGYEPLGLNKINEFYIKMLQQMGLVNHNGKVHWVKLIAAFTHFYGENLLKDLQSYIPIDQESTWLHKLLRRHRFTCHPLRHILIIGFLGETIDNMVQNISGINTKFLPFGHGPWPCLNKVANHYKTPVISSCEITSCSKTGLPIGTFNCSCGFIYSRKGLDRVNEDKFRIGRVKKFGGVWEADFQIISQLEIPLREKARLLGCDPQTVLNKLCSIKEVKESIVVHSNVQYRDKWTKLKNENQKLPTSELRKMNQGVYTWLYRHDKDWLKEQSPLRIKVETNLERIDWNRRDQKLAEAVKISADNILSESSYGSLIRVTKTEIGRRIVKLPLLINSINKLPETEKQLNLVIESMEEFQKRRINVAAAELKRTNMIIKRWELIRAAGLKEKFIENHSEILDSYT